MLNTLLCKGQCVAHNAPARPVYSPEYEVQTCELEKAARARAFVMHLRKVQHKRKLLFNFTLFFY